ncbi:peroxidasin isoform X3, partial [Biomphalaria pfeifferi]
LELLDIQPEFLNTPKNYNVEMGRKAVLECAIRNLMDRKVTWIKLSEDTPLTVGKETFQNTNRIFIEHEDNSPYWNLVISQVQLNDSGVYECQISSQYRHLRLHVLLTVVAAPATTTTPAVENSIQIYGSKFVEKERAILLTCNATGQEYVPEQLDWFFNGNKIVNDDPPGRVSI